MLRLLFHGASLYTSPLRSKHREKTARCHPPKAQHFNTHIVKWTSHPLHSMNQIERPFEKLLGLSNGPTGLQIGQMITRAFIVGFTS